MKRQIVKRNEYRVDHTPYCGATVHVVLECGHEKYYKRSAAPKGCWAQCRECDLVLKSEE